MDELRAQGLPVTFLCETFGVSRSGYYAMKKKGKKSRSSRRKDDALLLSRIRKICESHPF